MNILGIAACSHDGAVCLLRDGEIVASARDEQVDRKEQGSVFSARSIACCLQAAEISVGELDIIAVDAQPLVSFKRILKTALAVAPAGFRCFVQEMSPWLEQQFRLKNHIAEKTGFSGTILLPEHHEALAASAFFTSPFQEAAILTVDGVGEQTTTGYGLGTEAGVTVLAEMLFPHSPGLLYAAFFHFLGLKGDFGAGTLAEMATRGRPKYKNLILSTLLDLKDDGSFKLNMDYFDYGPGRIVANTKLARLFDRSPQPAESSLSITDVDIACSIQAVIEKILLLMMEHVQRKTGRKNLCLAGELAGACAAGGRLQGLSSYDEIRVQPAAGGAGAASGAALFAWHQYLGNGKSVISE